MFMLLDDSIYICDTFIIKYDVHIQAVIAKYFYSQLITYYILHNNILFIPGQIFP